MATITNRAGYVWCNLRVSGRPNNKSWVHIEVCFKRSTLTPDHTLHCPYCNDWQDSIPDGDLIVCDECGSLTLTTRSRTCMTCKAEIPMEEGEDG